jgi:hypothetical protein
MLIFDALDHLARVFGDMRGWRIAGGLALASHARHFHRYHQDIDLVVEERSLTDFVARARQQRYQTYQKQWGISFFPVAWAYGLQYLEKPENCRPPQSGILLLNPDPAITNPFLCKLDLTVVANDGVAATDGASREFDRYTTPSGHTVDLVGLKYLHQVKQRRNKPADRADLRIIRELLGRHSGRTH